MKHSLLKIVSLTAATIVLASSSIAAFANEPLTCPTVQQVKTYMQHSTVTGKPLTLYKQATTPDASFPITISAQHVNPTKAGYVDVTGFNSMTIGNAATGNTIVTCMYSDPYVTARHIILTTIPSSSVKFKPTGGQWTSHHGKAGGHSHTCTAGAASCQASVS